MIVERQILMGNSQGIILGPLFFILYVLMPDNSEMSYVQGNVIITTGENWVGDANKMNDNVDQLAYWLDFSKLPRNLENSRRYRLGFISITDFTGTIPLPVVSYR